MILADVYTPAGPAIYLTNLIPSAASVLDPDPKLVHALLIRASLPLEIIALACCILDSLNCRFARKWRRRCPIQAGLADDTVSHIDIIRPEIIVLSSLILAVKFQDDSEASSKAYCTHWGLGAWTVSQLNVTEQCILETLGYRIMPLWKEDLIQDALLDMERAGMNAWYGDSWSMASDYTFQETQDSPSKAMSAGKAVWTAQRQLTPVLTPRAEMAPFIADYLRIESTFRLASPQLSYQGAILDLPIRVLGLLDLQSEPAISVASN